MAIFSDIEVEATKSEPTKKEPGALSLRTNDLLDALTKASPASAGLMMRAMNQGELQRRTTERGLDKLRRRSEAEAIVAEEGDTDQLPQILSRHEWAKLTHPDEAKRNSRPRHISKMLDTGYEAYLGMVELRMKQALNQAKIATETARAGALERSQQPGSPGELITELIRQGKPIPPHLLGIYHAGTKSKEGIAARGLASKETQAGLERTSREGLAARALTSKEEQAGLGRSLKVSESALERGLEVSESALDRAAKATGKAAKPLLTPAKVSNVVISAKNVGKLGKDEERLTFDDWMFNQYLPIARSATPEQRAKIKKGLGDKLPSAKKLIGMLVVPPSSERGLFFKKTVPPTREAIEGGFDTLDFVIEGLRLRGWEESKIENLMNRFSGKLLDARGRNGN